MSDPEQAAELSMLRLEVLERLVERAEADGRGRDIETLLLRTSLAFLLVSAGDAESIGRAEEMLGPLRSDWTLILQPDDRWLGQVDAIAAAATVNRLRNQDAQPITGPQRSALDQARTLLESQEALLSQDDPGSPLHFMVLNAMHDLYEVLGDPESRDRVHARRASFVAPSGSGGPR